LFRGFPHKSDRRPPRTKTFKALKPVKIVKRDLILVSMPFGSLPHPSIGLSLLKASLKDVSAKVLYFTLPFAELIGEEWYNLVAQGKPTVSCAVGEWIFSSSVFEEDCDRSQQYIEEVLKPQAGSEPVSDGFIRNILHARRQAGPFLDACAERVLQYGPKIVGFTSVSQQQLASLGLAKRLKALNPDISVAFGGANCEGVMGMEILRQFPCVDAVVSGEGDIVFPKLVERIMNRQPLAGLQGVHARRGAAELPSVSLPCAAPPVREMDALPYPDYDDFFEQWRSSRVRKTCSPILLFETARGCWWGEKHHCTFCGLNGTSMEFRSKSAKRALEELVFLVGRYPASSVAVVDNILDMKYFKDFVPELARRRLKLNLFYEMKANLTKEQVCQLRDAGISEIQPGIESLSDSVLKLMRKGITGFQNIQLLKWCKEAGIRPMWNLLWGFPGENAEEYARMAGLVPLLTHLAPPCEGMPICLYRFSPNFDEGKAMGFTNIRPSAAYDWIYPFDSQIVSNMCYYFDYDYQDPRDVPGYTSELATRIAEWKDAYDGSELFYVDRGAQLLIWDFRPVASKALTVVEGLRRMLYLECDRVSSIARLARQYGNGDASIPMMEAELRPLLESGLMIRNGDRVLSLAVRRESRRGKKKEKNSRMAVRPQRLPSAPAPTPGAARNGVRRADFPETGPGAKSSGSL
jgi:ribosomal peptide maturation radical SAM protein 1